LKAGAIRSHQTADVNLESLEKLKDANQKVREQLSRVVVDQNEVLEQLLISIFARGHCILEGCWDWRRR
jgi:MoxR-like ATPase